MTTRLDTLHTHIAAVPEHRKTAIITLAGAAMIGVGVMLPWLTLFAGLQAFTGTTGRNGQIVLAGAAAAALLALASFVRPVRALQLATITLGAALTGFSAWLLVGARALAHRDAGNPMMLARLGPGLLVVLAGSVIIALAPTAAELFRRTMGHGSTGQKP
ncbi:MAG: hypothetical protein ABI637_00985 [Gemmatimonadota bacterium]